MTFMEAFQNVLPELTSKCENGEELYDVLRENNAVSWCDGGCPDSFLNNTPYRSYCEGVSCGKCYESEILPEDFNTLCFRNTRNDLIPDDIANIPFVELFRRSSRISDDDLMALLQGGE